MLRILFLAANPASVGTVDLTKQVDRIFARLRETSLSVRVEIRVVWDAAINEVEQHLRQFNPNVLHITGHGSPQGEPIVLGQTGRAVALPLAPLAALVAQLGASVQCIVLNACNTDTQAAALADVTLCTVAMQAPIFEVSAALFASSFYTALAAGDSVQAAFDLARIRLAAAGRPDAEVPVLRCRDEAAGATRLVRGLDVFCLYEESEPAAHKELTMRLKPLSRAGAIQLSGQHAAPPGADERLFVEQQMRQADIYLLLVTPYFIGSDDCMALAEEGLRRARLGQAVVVPILLRESDWRNTVFGGLKPLPDNRGSVLDSGKYKDQVWQEVVVGIQSVLKGHERRLIELAKTLIAAPLAASPAVTPAGAPALPAAAAPAGAPNLPPPIAPKNPAPLPPLPKTDADIIRAVRVRRYLGTLPRGLDREVSEVFGDTVRIKAIIQESGSLLAELSPSTMALPLSYVTFENGALMTWRSTLTEAAKVGPLALIAILLVARSQVNSQLPILEDTLRFIVAQEA